MRSSSLVVAVVVAGMLLASCVTVKPPIKSQRGPGWYTVKKSDTLYSIAWRYSLDYKQLAHWNRIDVNAPIYPGQRLRLIKPASTRIASGSTAKPKARTKQPASSSVSGKKTSQSSTATARSNRSDPKHWIWPTRGTPLNTFLASQLDRRGIDIAGRLGQPVRAIADGRVVYSGNGLAGYGNLIIIKHSDTYLSAYAYCQERLVQEGVRVKAGKVVAKMGSKDNTAKLYFEIRRNGKPVDPMKYLPNR